MTIEKKVTGSVSEGNHYFAESERYPASMVRIHVEARRKTDGGSNGPVYYVIVIRNFGQRREIALTESTLKELRRVLRVEEYQLPLEGLVEK